MKTKRLAEAAIPGGRKMRKLRGRILHLLELDETRGLKHWDLKPKLGELSVSIGRTAAQTTVLFCRCNQLKQP